VRLHLLLRAFDIFFSLVGLIVLTPLAIVIFFTRAFTGGHALFYQERVGRLQKRFILLKFRSMRVDAPSVATHLVDARLIDSFGRFLRRSKLDEFPQFWNVLKGEMSIVGPRPCLSGQRELIEARERLGVFSARPGLTGLAQINGIDMSEPQLLAEMDAEMLNVMCPLNYFKYILLTAAKLSR
jgi:O-antigen biosynthesis protein WbqP